MRGDSRAQELRRLSRLHGGDPQARTALLAQMLRTAPACERCQGLGQVEAVEVPVVPPHIAGSQRYWRPLTNPTRLSCTTCAGTGSPLRARVELAAYCGDEGSVACMAHWHPDADRVNRTLPLSGWLAGLSRWSDVGPAPGWVLVRAAVAAARVALPYAERGLVHSDGRPVADDHTFLAPRRAIEAAEAWLACPCKEHRRRVLRASGGGIGTRITFYEGAAVLLRDWSVKEQWAEAVFRAAETAGEQPVRDAIRSSLIEWALEEVNRG